MRTAALSMLSLFLVHCSRVSALRFLTGTTTRGNVPRGAMLTMATQKGEKLPATAKRAYVRPDRLLDIAGCVPQIFLRLGSGALVDGYELKLSKEGEGTEGVYAAFGGFGYKILERGDTWQRAQPRKPIELYEFEGCPFCRKVREAVNILDLDVIFYPCPKDGPTFRPKAAKLGGQQQFPYMVDPNTKASMYESDEIIKYLFDTYGQGAKVPFQLTLGPVTTLSAALGLLPRASKGSRYVPAKMPKKPVEVWGYEASPFTKVVREKLCELEIPHKFVAAARGSPKRQRLFEMAGAGQTPYLIDPNTGARGYESSEIVDYLEKTYAL